MIKETFLNDIYINKRVITFPEGVNKIEEYFSNNLINSVNIRLEFPLKNGVAATFNNHIEVEDLGKCFKKINDNLILIEFKEFTNVFAIDQRANIEIDFLHSRLYLLDFDICIHFNK